MSDHGIYSGIGYPSAPAQTGIGTQQETCPVEKIKHDIWMSWYLRSMQASVMRCIQDLKRK